MINNKKIIAVIPARGGSKGLPGKNIRPFMGLPLIAHSVLMAKMTPEIDRVIVSTDDPKIAKAAVEYGAENPFMRPGELAQDDTPMWPVIRHALQQVDDGSVEYLILLDPTSPGRKPDDIKAALEKLDESNADGIVGVSEPDFNPIWHSVVESDGVMKDLIEEGASLTRRQDAPTIYRINASLYIWRSEFIRKCEGNWRKEGKHLIYEIPESRAIHIDELYEFEKAELMVTHGLIQFPWLKDGV